MSDPAVDQARQPKPERPSKPESSPKPEWRMRPVFIIAASIIVLLLAVSVFGLTSLRLPFIRPAGSSEIIALFAMSAIIFLALVIFGFILFRSLFKLYLERQANQLGSKFKSKLVFGAIGLSVLPVFFLFLFSYSLINRTLDKWFSRPFETVSLDARYVAAALDEIARQSARTEALRFANDLSMGNAEGKTWADSVEERFPDLSRYGLDYVGIMNERSEALAEKTSDPALANLPLKVTGAPGLEDSAGGTELLNFGEGEYVIARAPFSGGDVGGGTVWIGMRLPANISESVARLNEESALYGALSRERRLVRQTYLSILLLLTVLILFIATWFALFLSRQVTVPIQALAQATHEVSRGNLNYRVQTRAADELGILVRSFNDMTAQLAASRAELLQSRNNLEQAHFELDQKHRLTETILDSIPTGVITVSGRGTILAGNPAARRMFGLEAVARQLSNLFSKEDERELRYLIKRASRLGLATKPMETRINGRLMHLAVTVSALPGKPPPEAGSDPAGWFVIVLEDLSDLLQAQKAAAWGEVAQRVAHEIKNPLTPIALSAERIRLWLERGQGTPDESPELSQVLDESCVLIQNEVETLKHLVDEFAQFARFPQAKPSPANLNQIVEKALGSFNGRFEGIRIVTRLDPDLPVVMADAEQLRRVVVNLMDNAADAMEHSVVKEMVIVTRSDPHRSVVEAEISDTGCGVSPEDREKLFLPYFSTKNRGSGLGLAIVNRIVAEHNGSIRVEENSPLGTRFVVELPLKVSQPAS
jgi:PAS domain S-box-containing protein